MSNQTAPRQSASELEWRSQWSRGTRTWRLRDAWSLQHFEFTDLQHTLWNQLQSGRSVHEIAQLLQVQFPDYRVSAQDVSAFLADLQLAGYARRHNGAVVDSVIAWPCVNCGGTTIPGGAPGLYAFDYSILRDRWLAWASSASLLPSSHCGHSAACQPFRIDSCARFDRYRQY